MTQNGPLADRSVEEIADLVVQLRSAQDCATKRLSRNGHEFVVAKHTRETRTDIADALELCWIAGARAVDSRQVEKLRQSARSIDASHASIVTVGDGRVEAQLGADTTHWPGTDLRAALEETGLAGQVDTDGSAPTADTRTRRSSDATQSGPGQSDPDHTERWDSATARVGESPVDSAWARTSRATVALGAESETTWPWWDAATGR